jgi:hypothetical protein
MSSLIDLKIEAKKRGIKGYSKLNRRELEKLLINKPTPSFKVSKLMEIKKQTETQKNTDYQNSGLIDISKDITSDIFNDFIIVLKDEKPDYLTFF